MIGKPQIGAMVSVCALFLAACSPPLAASPTAAPTAAPKPTTAAAPAGGEAAKPVAKDAAAPAAKTGGSPADDEIAKIKAQYYDAAKAEGKLVIYGVGNAELYNPVKAAFEAEFPGITIEGV